MTADWGGLACSDSCNPPLNFNVLAAVIRDEKDSVFTQVLMGKWEHFKLFTLNSLLTNWLIFSTFFCNYLCKILTVWQKDVIRDMGQQMTVSYIFCNTSIPKTNHFINCLNHLYFHPYSLLLSTCVDGMLFACANNGFQMPALLLSSCVLCCIRVSF